MNPVNKNKWQVRAAALTIFLLGFLAGGLALNAYYGRRSMYGPTARNNRFEQMLGRLHLSLEQKTEVEKILGDTRQQLIALRKQSEPQVNEIRRQADERLQQVLTPEQWQQFQQMKNEIRGRWRREGK